MASNSTPNPGRLYECVACNTAYPKDEAVCPSCGTPNPTVGRLLAAPPQSPTVGEAQKTLKADGPGSISSGKSNATSKPGTDTPAQPSALKLHLDAIHDRDAMLGEDTPKRAYVILFGSAGAGKTFLIDRIKKLDPDSVSRAETNKFRESTKTNDFNPISFQFGGSSVRRPVTLIDIPGEEFRLATAGHKSQVAEQVRLSIEVLNGVILYISARDLLNTFEGGSEVASDASTEKNYIDLLKVVHLNKCGGISVDDAIDDINKGLPSPVKGKSSVRVYVAISKCDMLPDWKPINGPSGEDLLRKHANGLLTVLQERYRWFACGLVASHVGAPTYTGLRFTRLDNQQNTVLAEYSDDCRASIRNYRFKSFIEEHWKNPSNKLVADSQTLPTTLENRTREEHLRDAAEFFADQRNASELVEILERIGVSVEQRPYAHNSCPSYGVLGMLAKLDELYAASESSYTLQVLTRESSADTDVISYYLKMGQGGLSPGRENADPDPLTVKPRLPFPLPLIQRGIAVAGMLLCAGAVAGASWLAKSGADDDDKALRNKLAGLKYPPGFRIKAVDAWKIDDIEPVQRVVNGLATTQNALFGLQDDYLVRSPDLSVNQLVDDTKEAFQALSTTTSERTEKIYRDLRCNEPRFCPLDRETLSPLPVAPTVKDLAKDGREFTYALALSHYRRLTAHVSSSSPKAALNLLDTLLNDFEKRREDTFGKTEGNKQKLLPRLAVDLVRAHARYVTQNSDLATYGEALVDALKPKRKVSAEELRLIGVSQSLLAQHLLATSFLEGETIKTLAEKFDKRLELIGVSGGSLSLFESGRSTASNPLLMCIVGQIVVHATSKPLPLERVAKACSEAPVDDNLRRTNTDFWRRASLTNSDFWHGPESVRQDFPLEKYLPLIQQAAKRPEFVEGWPDDTDNDLQGFRKKTLWTILTEPIRIAVLLFVLILIACGCWVVNRRAQTAHAEDETIAKEKKNRAIQANLWNRGRGLFVTPLSDDSRHHQ